MAYRPDELGLTSAHNLAVANMQENPAKYGIESQFDYAAESAKDMINRASNPLTSVVSAVGNVAGRPVYDFYDAAKEYGKKGYQGEFSFSPQGAVDFLGNLKSLGGEFLAQKPHIMMGGALKGGIESLGTQLGEGIYDYIHGPQMKFKQQQLMNKKKQKQADVFKKIKEKQLADAAAKAKADAAAAAPTSHAEARSTGGDYHSGHQSTVGGQTTDWGSESAMIARGGLAQHAPRYANGGLIDFFRYGGFIG